MLWQARRMACCAVLEEESSLTPMRQSIMSPPARMARFTSIQFVLPMAESAPKAVPKRQPHFLFQLPDSIGQAGLRNIELLHCMADGAGAGNSRDIAELLKGHGSFLSACFFYPTAEPPKTQRIFFFEIPNEHCRHIQDTFYPPCNFPYNSTAVLKRLQHSHITKEAFRYGTTAK